MEFKDPSITLRLLYNRLCPLPKTCACSQMYTKTKMREGRKLFTNLHSNDDERREEALKTLSLSLSLSVNIFLVVLFLFPVANSNVRVWSLCVLFYGKGMVDHESLVANLAGYASLLANYPHNLRLGFGKSTCNAGQAWALSIPHHAHPSCTPN